MNVEQFINTFLSSFAALTFNKNEVADIVRQAWKEAQKETTPIPVTVSNPHAKFEVVDFAFPERNCRTCNLDESSCSHCDSIRGR